MIGIVLVTHGRLAIEFRAALEHVVGPQEQIETVTIGPDDNVEQRRRDIIEAVKKVDAGDGVVILTDMFGGTPSNLAISVMSRPKVEVLAGINLPMLIKLVKVRDEWPLAEAVAAAQEVGPQIHHHREPGAGGQMNRDPEPTEDCPPDLPEAPPDAIVRSLAIINQRGLHARASAKFVQTVEKFDADVRVTRCGETVGGTSIMGLMMLAAGPGHLDHGDRQRRRVPPRSWRRWKRWSAGGSARRTERITLCERSFFQPDNDIKISLYPCCGDAGPLL